MWISLAAYGQVMVDIPEGYGADDELDPDAADPLYL